MVRNTIKVLVSALFCSLSATVAWADGAVYSMTNALDNNEVLVYHRAANGNLSNNSNPVQTIATGGGGSGLQLAGVDSLGSAGSIQLDPDHRLLFVVNTESAAENNGAGAYNTDCRQGTITSFRVADDGTLTFADRVFSGGLFPNSLTVRERHHDDNGRGHDEDSDQRGDLLYVLNAGGPEAPAICHVTPGTANTPNITGFRVDHAGHMIPIDSTQPIDPGPASASSGVSCTAAAAMGFSNLTGAPAADFQCGLNPPSFPRSPAQVRFTPNGKELVVTVKGTNSIYVFPVDKDGTADAPTVTQAPGPALPSFFGFTFDKKGRPLVTELFGTATSIPKGAAGALSSFAITGNGHLQAISSDIADGGTAACWIALEPINGRFAYVANNLGDFRISSYTVGNNGVVTLLNGTAASGAGPNDLAVAHEGGNSWLYVVNAGTGTVGAFHINGDGSLTAIMGGGGLPAGRSAQGLAAF
jgi:6-phosphogluconolactonase (cycloisomerase 2 family)